MKRRSEGGFTLLEITIAVVIAVAVLSIGTVAVSSSAHAFTQSAAYRSQAQEIGSLLDQLDVSAHTAVAIYTPSSCGSDAAGDPHGDNQPCSSVRFYGIDNTGGEHFCGWDYDTARHTLMQCRSYASINGACGTSGAQLQGILEFSATPRDVSHIAKGYGLGAAVEEYEMLDGTADRNERVVAGNRVMVVDVANQALLREKHLLQEGTPFSTIVLNGAITAPVLGPLTLSQPSLTFTSPSAASQTVFGNEQNYGQYATLPKFRNNNAWFVLSNGAKDNAWPVACTDGGGTVIASVVPLSASGTPQTDPQYTNKSIDGQSFGVSPQYTGTCTLSVATQDKTASLTVTVDAAPMQTDPGGIVFTRTPVLAYVRPRYDIAALLNGILGGGTALAQQTPRALAASVNSPASCTTGAYAVNVDGTVDANDSAIHTGPDGCFQSNPNVHVSQNGYAHAFEINPNACPVTSGNFSPGTGPNADVPVGLDSPPSSGQCTIAIVDASPPPNAVSKNYGSGLVLIKMQTVGPVQTDPGYILFTRNSVAVADAAQMQKHWIAQQINLLFGGAEALAAGPCLAFAYKSDPSTGGAVDASDTLIGSGPDGCIDGGDAVQPTSSGVSGANVYVTQSGNTKGFLYNPQTCSSYVGYGRWAGTTTAAALPVGLNSPPPGNACTFALIGQPGPTPSPTPAYYSGLVGARVVPTCDSTSGAVGGSAYVPVGETCTTTVARGSVSGDCTLNGGDTTEWVTWYSASITGGSAYGTLTQYRTSKSNTYWTFIRSVAGSVVVTEYQNDVQYAPGSCRQTQSSPIAVGSWVYF